MGVSRNKILKTNRILKTAQLLFFLAFIPAGVLFSQTDFVKGEEFFVQNKPEEALAFLEKAVSDDPVHVQAFLYLGIVYQQLERPEDALAAYMKILPRAGAESARVAFNIGNVYFSEGNFESAYQYFSQAITIDPSLSSAWLNRANSLVKKGILREAVVDYERYLLLEPHTTQREDIEKLVAFLYEEIAEEERRLKESGSIELDKRRRLIEEVSSSLKNTAEDSSGLSTRAAETEETENLLD